MIQDILARVAAGDDLSMDEMSQAVDLMMQGAATDDEMAALLTGLGNKGETVDELAGAAAAMRRHMTPIRTRRAELVDTCGTGGSGSGAFNISTAAAIVAAAAGVAVAKHGNRRITSKTGSADVLAELGVNVEASVATVEQCLDRLGLCFCFAPLLHGSMKHVAAVRRRLGVPTIFNLLGPLCNPASAPFQVLGVGKPDARHKLASALGKLNTRRAVVVAPRDGLGEITIGETTDVTLVERGRLRELQWTAADFGVAVSDIGALQAAGPSESAAIIRDVLNGRPGPPRDVVVVNAAAAIWIAETDPNLAACAARAATAIDSGAARALLARLIETSNA